MIEWIEYDKHSRDIESHVTCLVTDGSVVKLAQHAKLLDGGGYGWHILGGYRFNGVTHWAKVNLPVKAIDIKAEKGCPYCGATTIHYCSRRRYRG